MLIALHVDIVIKIDNLGFNTGGGVSFKDLKEASKKKYADVRGRWNQPLVTTSAACDKANIHRISLGSSSGPYSGICHSELIPSSYK